jgi:hypothetical protein
MSCTGSLCVKHSQKKLWWWEGSLQVLSLIGCLCTSLPLNCHGLWFKACFSSSAFQPMSKLRFKLNLWTLLRMLLEHSRRSMQRPPKVHAAGPVDLEAPEFLSPRYRRPRERFAPSAAPAALYNSPTPFQAEAREAAAMRPLSRSQHDGNPLAPVVALGSGYKRSASARPVASDKKPVFV